MHLDYNNIGETEIEAAATALREGQISTKGKYVDEFETVLNDYFGTPYVLATNSGTAALHIALLLQRPDSRAGLKKITIPDLTFVATRNAALIAGIEEIEVVDVDPDTWCLPIQPPRTVSIPVHLYGVLPESNPHDIHDAAEAFGNYHAQGLEPSPMVRNLHIYSFNGNKTLTTSGGGLLVCRNLAEYTEAKDMITPLNESPRVAYNYRMTSLAAAVGLAQFSRLGELLDRKKRMHEIYRNELGHSVVFQEGAGIRWMTACLFERTAAEMQSELKECGIPTRRVFRPLVGLPNAQRIWEHGLCLPSSTLNRDEDIEEVCEVIKRIL